MEVTFSCKYANIKEHDMEHIASEQNKMVELEAIYGGI